eukprot:1086718-Pleurochrysis_carterae.AAC.5
MNFANYSLPILCDAPASSQPGIKSASLIRERSGAVADVSRVPSACAYTYGMLRQTKESAGSSKDLSLPNRLEAARCVEPAAWLPSPSAQPALGLARKQMRGARLKKLGASGVRTKSRWSCAASAQLSATQGVATRRGSASAARNGGRATLLAAPRTSAKKRWPAAHSYSQPTCTVRVGGGCQSETEPGSAWSCTLGGAVAVVGWGVDAHRVHQVVPREKARLQHPLSRVVGRGAPEHKQPRRATRSRAERSWIELRARVWLGEGVWHGHGADRRAVGDRVAKGDGLLLRAVAARTGEEAFEMVEIEDVGARGGGAAAAARERRHKAAAVRPRVEGRRSARGRAEAGDLGRAARRSGARQHDA